MKKILILYTSVGLGHKSIAENIGYYLTQAGYEVRLEDILKVETGTLSSFGQWLHRQVNIHAPWLWSWLYKSEGFTNLTLGWRVPLAARHHHATAAIVTEWRPDAIVTTQTTATAVAAYLKRTEIFSGPLLTAFSDYHLHRYWLYDEVDRYLANVPEQVEDMARLGVARSSAAICGMLLKPELSVDVPAVRRKIGAGEGDKVVLLSSGSLGYGLSSELLDMFAARPNTRTVVVCGKNETARAELSDRYAGKPVSVFGFYQPMDELYAVADLLVGKPGGLTVAEALRRSLPILVSHVLPGQEEYNYAYLAERSLVMPEPMNLFSAADEELETGQFRAQLGQNPNRQAIAAKPEILTDCVRGAFG